MGDAVRLEGIRAILFDLDGTLLEQTIDFAAMKQRVLQAARTCGADPTPWESLPSLELLQNVVAALGPTSDAAMRFASCANQAIIDLEVQAAERAAPYPGVPAMLRVLARRGYAVGIVTRNSRAAVERVLARVSLPCRVLLTRDDVRHVKPDPRHLLDALDAMGMRGQRTLMCGDHPMDIAAGRGIGALTVGVLRPGEGPAALADAQPDLILRRVTDLLLHLS